MGTDARTKHDRKLLERNRELERKLDECQGIYKEIAEAIAQGREVVVTDSQLVVDPDGKVRETRITRATPVLSPEAAQQYVERAFETGFEQAAEHILPIIETMEGAVKQVEKAVAIIHACSICDNGKRTRALAQTALNDFVASVQNLRTELGKVEGKTVLVFPPLGNAERYWATLRQQTEDFLRIGTDTEQNNLAALAARHTSICADVYETFKSVKKRGAARDRAHELIGRMAAEYPEPEEFWPIGIDIYDQLRTIPQSAISEIQQNALDQLKSYFPIETKGADGRAISHRTDLGRKIARARKDWIDRSTLETASSNNSVT